MFYKVVKRILDISISLIVIVIFSPVIVSLYFIVRNKLGRPVLFSQERPGLEGKIFRMYKFRSMNSKTDKQGNLLPDKERLTPFGRKLRSTSLDELPGLFNVLKGDMSLVGPRPLLKEYLPYYTEEEMRRHTVRPGITGLAQVSGRNALTWEQKFQHDIYYVENMSLWLDFKVLLLTLIKVVKKDSILESAPQGPLHKYRGCNVKNKRN